MEVNGFKVGSKVRCVESYAPYFTKGNIYEVREPVDDLDCFGIARGDLTIKVDDLGLTTNGLHACYFERVERVEDKIEVGDRVRFRADQLPRWRDDLNTTSLYDVDNIETDGPDDEMPLAHLAGVLNPVGRQEGFLLSRFELVEKAKRGVPSAETAPAPSNANDGQAMRFNNSKSDLAYFLSFDGGPEILFPADSEFHDAAVALGVWYRASTCDGSLMDELFEEVVSEILDRTDRYGTDWPEQFAAVCQFGAKKYARGNFLKGRGYHDTCNSLLRHMLQIERGEDVDSDSQCEHIGHIVWNLAFLRHCYRTFGGNGGKFDDRLRAPAEKKAFTFPSNAEPKVGDLFRCVGGVGGALKLNAVYRVIGKSKGGWYVSGLPRNYDVALDHKGWWEPVASDYTGPVEGEVLKAVAS